MNHPSYPDLRLPGEAPGVARWTPYRKAELLRRIRAGEITADVACQRFGFTFDELAATPSRNQRYGHAGLFVTRLQVVR